MNERDLARVQASDTAEMAIVIHASLSECACPLVGRSPFAMMYKWNVSCGADSKKALRNLINATVRRSISNCFE